MYFWEKGTIFHLPYGYFNSWFLFQTGEQFDFPDLNEYLSNLAAHSSNTGYDPKTGLYNPSLLEREDDSSPTISFWMPSLRYVEYNMRRANYFRPCEPGREPPDESQYVVQFWIEWAGTHNVEQSPQVKRFENAQLRPLSTPNDFQRFEDDYYVLLGCHPNGGCDGWIWDREKNYILFIQFPELLRQFDPENFWREPVNAAVQLLESWKVNEDIEIDN